MCVCVYIYMSTFFPLSFKKYNKLDEYIYIYFFIISILPLKQQTFIFGLIGLYPPVI